MQTRKPNRVSQPQLAMSGQGISGFRLRSAFGGGSGDIAGPPGGTIGRHREDMFGKGGQGCHDGILQLNRYLHGYLSDICVFSMGRYRAARGLPLLSRSSCRARSLREVELEKRATRKASRSPALTWSHGIPSMIKGQYGGSGGRGGWLR